MSQDTYVYLVDKNFPNEAWNNLVSEYGLQKDLSGKFWITSNSDEPIKITVEEIDENHVQYGKFNWVIGVHLDGGRCALGFWGLVAFPYYCMVYLDSSVFYDARADAWIESIDKLEKYASQYLFQFISLQKLAKAGLVDSDENIVLTKQFKT